MIPTRPAAPPQLFDRNLIARRRQHADPTPDFVTELALVGLGERLEHVQRRFRKVALTGPGLASATPHLPSVDAVEIFPSLVPGASDDMPGLVDRDYDLIVSLLDLQVVNDVPGTLTRIRRHLVADGLFLSAALGGRSLVELRAAWIEADSALTGGAYGRIAPFMDVKDAGALLQRAGFALPVSDVDTHSVRYADPLKLMRELKTLGAANPMLEKPAKPVTRHHLAAAVSAYPVDSDGRITATLELVWMSGWAPETNR